MSYLGRIAAGAALAGALVASPALAALTTFTTLDGGVNSTAQAVYDYDTGIGGWTLRVTDALVNITALGSFLGSSQATFSLDAYEVSPNSYSGTMSFVLPSAVVGDVSTTPSDFLLGVNFKGAALGGVGNSLTLFLDNFAVDGTDASCLNCMYSDLFDFFSGGPSVEQYFQVTFDLGFRFNFVDPVSFEGKIAQGYFQTDPPLPGVDIPGVPEPTTWAMILVGFGLVGAGLRGRKPNVVLA